LKNSTGDLVYSTTFPTDYFVDIGNPEYQDWVAEWISNITSVTGGFDGVFADVSLATSAGENYYDASSKPINPRTGKEFTDEEVVNYFIQLMNRVKNKIGSKVYIPNGIFQGERFFDPILHDGYMKILNETKIDGFMSEALFNVAWYTRTEPYVWEWNWYSEDKWKMSLDFVVWIQDNFLTSNKLYLPYGLCGSYGFTIELNSEQVAKFVFASLLLGIKKSQNYLFLAGGCTLEDYSQKLYNIDLGYPLEDYYRIEGTHVYTRDFSKVKALVNPTNSIYTVPLGKNYKTLEGQIVSSITMNNHTGEILLKIIE
jgi:hypothetical protein